LFWKINYMISRDGSPNADVLTWEPPQLSTTSSKAGNSQLRPGGSPEVGRGL
jgi:hypothetical protein